MFVPLLLAILAFGGAVARAQVPLELRGQRVVEVEVAGDTAGLTSEREVGIPLGAPISRRLVRSALRRLVATGRWADVQVDLVPARGGVRVVAHLTPRVTLTRVEILGNDVVDDEELLRATQLGTSSELREDTLAEAVSAAEALYAERGYRNARVQAIVRDTDDPAQKVLLLRIREGEPVRISGLQFAGTRPPPESRVADTLDLERGAVLDLRDIEERVREAEQVMRERGWLEAELGDPVITAAAKNRVTLSLPSEPGPRYAVVVRGYQPLERGDVEEVLRLGAERLDGTVLESMRERVVDLYRQHGFHDVRVWMTRGEPEDEARASSRPDGATEDEAELRVRVEPGPQLDVLAISFPGALHFDTQFLRDQIFSYLQEDLPGSGVFDPVDTEVVDAIGFSGDRRFRREVPAPLEVEPRRVYYRPTYDEAIEHIQELYQAEGYLNVRVGPPELRRLDREMNAAEEEPDRRRRRRSAAVVVVPVVEGPRSMLHRVHVEGNEVLTAREILTAAGLERGAPFSHLALEEARLRILERYRDEGHLYARIEPTLRFSADRTRADVTLQVVERYPVHIGEIRIEGANRTSEALIRARLEIETGDLYRPATARRSQERLIELGIFSGVNVAPQDADLPARVKPVVVTVTERPGQFLDFSAGLSTGEGIRGGFEYGYRNLFGYAVGLSLRVQLAYQFIFVEDEIEQRFEALPLEDRLERSVTFGITVPHIPLPKVRLSLDLVHLRDNERDFGLDKNGVVLGLTWRPARRWTITVAENLENNNVDLLVDVESLEEYLEENEDPRLERILRVPEGESTILATQTAVSFDGRDSPFVPTKGVFVGTRAEYARTLTTESNVEDASFFSDFVKLGVTTSGYVPMGEDLVWATQLRFGRVFHLATDSQTYPNRRFYLGGVDTLRGYLQDALVPQDVVQAIEEGELDPDTVVRGGDAFVLIRSELRFPISGDLHGGVFADVGNLWADPSQVAPLDLRPTAGLGLRLATPVGPLAFDYGFNLLRRESLGESLGAFHFSIGLF